jgi:hypothetical protein
LGADSPLRHEFPQLPVDAHVHFHRREFVAPTLDAAAENFARVASPAAGYLGALLLAEAPREQVFETLADSKPHGRWRFDRVAEEPQTMIARSGEQRIAVICGRQVRCAFGLEALALGTTARLPSGQELEQTIERIRADGALAVVPWGFGKWIGRAGDVVRTLFDTCAPDSLYVGDNGGRLETLGMPNLLRVAIDAGLRVLPGTDPFPFGADYRRVGAFGFLAAVELEPARPWASLRTWLEGSSDSPQPYGRALSPLRFVFNQGWIQAHNRLMAGATA